jgi:DNA-binding CsgD family transcriptional regulator
VTEPTPRQLQVLVAWIECGNADEAGRRLGLHPSTVRHILSDVQAVLGAAHSGQAFAIAVRLGLIDPSTLRLPDAA